ncbi:MAG: pantetheine-phosphate adenylyltransferase [Candidatus Heimdallarchaeota archaeon]
MKEKLKSNYPYEYVGLGGSFDHLHEGHHELLKTAFKVGEKVGIALTTDKLHSEKEKKELIESYEVRKKKLEKFIIQKLGGNNDRFEIMALNDPFGIAITDNNLQAHVSSLETYKVAFKINEIRLELGLNPLTLIIIPLVFNNEGKKISSSEIRKQLVREKK